MLLLGGGDVAVGHLADLLDDPNKRCDDVWGLGRGERPVRTELVDQDVAFYTPVCVLPAVDPNFDVVGVGAADEPVSS